MWRCGALRRFMVRGRSAGAQTAAGRGAGCVQYLRSLQNTGTKTEDMFGSPQRLCAAVQGCKAMYQRILITNMGSAPGVYFAGIFLYECIVMYLLIPTTPYISLQKWFRRQAADIKQSGIIRRHFGKQMVNRTKLRIRNIRAKAALKFGSEPWVLNEGCEKGVEASQMRFLRLMYGITKLDQERN